MNRRADSIDLHDVEREIRAGFRALRFRTNVERQFESDIGDDRCKFMTRLNYIGMIIYHFFLFSDYKSISDAFYFDLFVHFIVITPLILVLNFVLLRRPPVWLREGLEVFTITVLAASIVVVVSYSRMPDRDVINFGLALVLLFATMVQRIRFRYVIFTCIVIQILHGFSSYAIDTMSSERVVMLNFFFMGVVIFSLVGSYCLEHEHRMGYLLRLRDRFRNKQLEMVSLRDALTGIGNRRALDSDLGRLPDEGGKSSSRTDAFLLLDIDHFKQFNDTNGHLEGDSCLRRVAGIIEGSLRSGDQAAYRFGGEEFLVLLQDTSLDDALRVAERIRANVAHAKIVADPRTQSLVTLSIGVASGCVGRDATADSLIAAADSALYTAKRQGRNRVAAAEAGVLGAPLLAVA